MNSRKFKLNLLIPVLVTLACSVGICLSQDSIHRHIQTVEDAQLSKVVHVEATKDGRKIYTLGYRPGYIVWFDCDPQTGKLAKVNSFAESQLVSFDISEDQKWLVACCTSGKVMLFQRDLTTGDIDLVHTVERAEMPSLESTFSVKFSLDASYIYLACRSDRVIVLHVDEGKMSLVQRHNGVDGCLDRCEVVARNPIGNEIFVSSSRSGTVSVFQPDEDGHLILLNYVEDDSLQAALLAGIHGLAVSPDGKHLYVTSGRFAGDQGVSGFRVLEDSTLEKVSEFENGIELQGFEGGHYVKVSPDGKFVYATAAKSGRIACFRRDAKTGQLQFQEYLRANGKERFGGPSGIGFSSNGEFVYISIEQEGRVLAFRRVDK